MPDGDSDRRRFRFGAFVLDVDRAAPRRAGVDLRLRPRSFEVLRHLVERSGRLVRRDTGRRGAPAAHDGTPPRGEGPPRSRTRARRRRRGRRRVAGVRAPHRAGAAGSSAAASSPSRGRTRARSGRPASTPAPRVGPAGCARRGAVPRDVRSRAAARAAAAPTGHGRRRFASPCSARPAGVSAGRACVRRGRTRRVQDAADEVQVHVADRGRVLERPPTSRPAGRKVIAPVCWRAAALAVAQQVAVETRRRVLPRRAPPPACGDQARGRPVREDEFGRRVAAARDPCDRRGRRQR